MNANAQRTLYHLALLKRVGGTTRRRKRIPKQRYPKLIEAEYAKAMVRLLDEAHFALLELFARLAELVDNARAERKDAGESDELAAIMARVRARLEQAVNPVSVKELAQKFAERTQTAQRIALGAQVKAALGADVFSSDKRIPAIRDQFVGENVALIKTIPAQVLNEVEGVVSRAFTSATPHDVLLKQINERFSVGESRARVIARDQIGKLYGQTNAYRQQDLGITSFIWRTSGDERVRDEHAALEGQEFNYPDGAPEEGLPGEPIQCRCGAEPVFGNLLNAEEPEPSIETPPEQESVRETQVVQHIFTPADEPAREPQVVQHAFPDVVPDKHFEVSGTKLRLVTENKPLVVGGTPRTPRTQIQVLRRLSDGEEVPVATAEFIHRSGNALYPEHVVVDPAWQRKGIGNRIYAAAEQSTGRQIIPSENQTPQGKAFSEKFRGGKAPIATGPQETQQAQHATEAPVEPTGIPTYKSLEALPEDYLESTVLASEIAARGYYEPVSGHTDPVRNANARQAIIEGQREAISLNVTPSGKITVTGGRHRLKAAIELNARLKVKWHYGYEPSDDMVKR